MFIYVDKSYNFIKGKFHLPPLWFLIITNTSLQVYEIELTSSLICVIAKNFRGGKCYKFLSVTN